MDLINRVSFKQQMGDIWWWSPSANGIYSTKEAYRKQEIVEAAEPSSTVKKQVFKRLWKCWGPRRNITTTWRAMRDRLPTRDNLRKRDGWESLLWYIMILTSNNAKIGATLWIGVVRSLWNLRNEGVFNGESQYTP
ncbi:hypothetical protein ACS0TY_000975 [Phlomoides rotata]